jgi:hypothetical protein
MTVISVDVVSSPWEFKIMFFIPQKAAQSFTTSPPAMISLPLLIVPALKGI